MIKDRHADFVTPMNCCRLAVRTKEMCVPRRCHHGKQVSQTACGSIQLPKQSMNLPRTALSNIRDGIGKAHHSPNHQSKAVVLRDSDIPDRCEKCLKYMTAKGGRTRKEETGREGTHLTPVYLVSFLFLL